MPHNEQLSIPSKAEAFRFLLFLCCNEDVLPPVVDDDNDGIEMAPWDPARISSGLGILYEYVANDAAGAEEGASPYSISGRIVDTSLHDTDEPAALLHTNEAVSSSAKTYACVLLPLMKSKCALIQLYCGVFWMLYVQNVFVVTRCATDRLPSEEETKKKWVLLTHVSQRLTILAGNCYFFFFHKVYYKESSSNDATDVSAGWHQRRRRNPSSQLYIDKRQNTRATNAAGYSISPTLSDRFFISV